MNYSNLRNFIKKQLLKEEIEEETANDIKQGIAIVPGAFRPPHLGHVKMVDHYLTKAQRVKVVISNPKSSKSKRLILGSEITADISKKLWEIMLSGKSNVDVEISSSPSPVTIAYQWAEGKAEGADYDNMSSFGNVLYLGASVKGNDINRFSRAQQSTEGTHIMLQDVSEHAAPAEKIDSEYLNLVKEKGLESYLPSKVSGKDPLEYHASDLRFLLEKYDESPEFKKILENYVGAGNVTQYINTLFPNGRHVQKESAELKNYIKLFI